MKKEYYLYASGLLWKYNAATDSWQQQAPFSVVNDHKVEVAISFSVNGNGYVLGDLDTSAYNHGEPLTLWSYNASAN